MLRTVVLLVATVVLTAGAATTASASDESDSISWVSRSAAAGVSISWD